MTDNTLICDRLDLDSLARGQRHRFWITLIEDASSQPLRIPVIVCRGASDGPVFGVTAVVHGNELNGLPTTHRLVRSIDPDELAGTIVVVPVVNLPGYLRNTRGFTDGKDLNRLMPGRENGAPSDVYAHRFIDRIVRRFEYLVDLHTASFGRINSLYVRADMRDPITATMSRLISPQIIVHNEGADGTLRSAADELGVHAITVEVGNPQRFQRGLIRSSRLGIQNLLAHLDMIPQPPDEEDPIDDDTVECSRSFWLYADTGGVLQIFVTVAERVKRGERVAILSNLFGDVIREYCAPEDGIIIGANTNPVASTGARIVHLGIEKPATHPATHPAQELRAESAS